MPDKIDEITLEDILLWINRNSKDTDAMSKIAYSAFPFSEKFQSRYRGNPQDDGIDLVS